MLIYSHWWFASSVLVHVLTQVQSCALGSCSVLDAADGTSCKDAKARLCQPLLLPLWWSLLRMHSSSFTSFGCLDAGQEVQVALESCHFHPRLCQCPGPWTTFQRVTQSPCPSLPPSCHKSIPKHEKNFAVMIWVPNCGPILCYKLQSGRYSYSHFTGGKRSRSEEDFLENPKLRGNKLELQPHF